MKQSTPDLGYTLCELILQYMTPTILENLMIYNQITLSKLDKILNTRFKDDGFLSLKDLPFPSTLKDMTKATNRIIKAINNKEKIALIGDYDVDGVVSTAIMKMFFNHIGVELKTIIPNRFKDGYGMSLKLINQLSDYDLILTVDNGISALEASILAKELNIELIITDHHIVPLKLPLAHSIVNQKQDDCEFPFDEICGAQISWYLIASLNSKIGSGALAPLNKFINKIEIKQLLELVSIAIIADVMPLLHINRAMVISGLKTLNQSLTPSILALKEYLKVEIFTSETIGFFIAPLLNSAGRMEDASYAFDFLLSENIADAKENLLKLIDFNTDRKEVESNITKEAITKVGWVEPTTSDKYNQDNIIIVYGENWHEGVVGIVASRVSTHFAKPAIILSKDGDKLKGSGRSYGECDLFDIVNQSKDLLLGFGGHKMAVGLALDINNFDAFKESLQKNYKAKNYNQNIEDKELIGELDFKTIDFDLINIIEKYAPYGNLNSNPKFITHNVKVISCQKIGKDKNHLKLTLSQGYGALAPSSIINAIKFRDDSDIKPNSIIDIKYRVNKNIFRGKESLQLMIDEITTD